MMILYMSLIDSKEDRDKFEIIYYEYRTRMYGAAFEILESKEDSEDAVHNAFVGIAENIKAIRDPIEPSTLSYVIKAAKNAAINIYDEKRRHPHVNFSESIISDREFLGRLQIRQRYNDVVEAIMELDDLYKIPMYCYYVGGMKIKEIARFLSLSPSAVKMRVNRGKRKLLNILEENR